jgi:uncharacterized protein (DUF1697 family)
MADLKTCFEAAGFADVRTVLGTGNVVFEARASSEATLARRAEAAMTKALDRSFLTIVRPIAQLRALLEADPYRAFRLAPDVKRVVTFLREAPRAKVSLPIELDGARILTIDGTEIFTVYVPGPRGPVFMSLIERTFGEALTTRTWDTVKKVAR